VAWGKQWRSCLSRKGLASGTVNSLVGRRLSELAERLRRFAPAGRSGDSKNDEKDK